MNKKSNLLESPQCKAFELLYQPIDYQLSVALQNLIATYGKEDVKKFLFEVYNVTPIKTKKVG